VILFCPYCGAANDDNNFRCTKCKQVIQPAVPTVVTSDLSDSAAMRMLLPIGRSGLAIAAGYAGLFAILLIPAPLALLLGILAIRDLKKHPKKYGRGRAIFGLVMGGVCTLLLCFVMAQIISF
jgi:predicted acyltransferase